MNFKKLIKEKYPDYDENRRYPRVGEMWKLTDNQTKVLIMDYYTFNKYKCMILKPGFYFKKCEVVMIEKSDFSYLTIDEEFKQEEIKMVKEGKIFYDPGDIINVVEHDAKGVVIRNDSYFSYQVFLLAPHKYQNNIVCIDKRYKEYKNSFQLF